LKFNEKSICIVREKAIMKRFKTGVFLTFYTLSIWAVPPQMTSEELSSVCGEGIVESEQICSKFMEGIYSFALDSEVACDPEREGAGEARRYILVYIRENPQEGNSLASEIALDALSQAFPCH
jgi:hypothetical protein